MATSSQCLQAGGEGVGRTGAQAHRAAQLRACQLCALERRGLAGLVACRGANVRQLHHAAQLHVSRHHKPAQAQAQAAGARASLVPKARPARRPHPPPALCSQRGHSNRRRASSIFTAPVRATVPTTVTMWLMWAATNSPAAGLASRAPGSRNKAGPDTRACTDSLMQQRSAEGPSSASTCACASTSAALQCGSTAPGAASTVSARPGSAAASAARLRGTP